MKESYENAIVISLKNDISEIKDLADSLNYNIINSFIQHRENPDVNSYIGRGKVDEIIKFLESSEKKINLIIVDGELKPSQWFNLEKKFNIDVYDRTRLILAIFEKRAEKRKRDLERQALMDLHDANQG